RRPDDDDHLARLDGEIDIGEHPMIAKGLADTLDAHQGHADLPTRSRKQRGDGPIIAARGRRRRQARDAVAGPTGRVIIALGAMAGASQVAGHSAHSSANHTIPPVICISTDILRGGRPSAVARRSAPRRRLVGVKGRSYEVRTFGCQMNVHDSERLSGLLESAGYVPVAPGGEPDVVVFNTCAVRENADNRLYGNLGQLVPVKKGHP